MTSLTETTKIDLIQILEDGQIQVRQVTTVYRDDHAVANEYHRLVLEPGDSKAVEILGDRYAVAQAVWTPEVIAAWEAQAQNLSEG